MPVAHYLCGGIAIDDCGRTSMPGLIALGECAGSGLHGADRLASNSLLEALVIPRRAALATLELQPKGTSPPLPRIVRSKLSRKTPEPVVRALAGLRHAMSAHVGIVRDHEGMAMALRSIAHCERAIAPMWLRRRWSAALMDLRDLAAVARAITEAAVAEPRSIGAHHLEEREHAAL